MNNPNNFNATRYYLYLLSQNRRTCGGFARFREILADEKNEFPLSFSNLLCYTVRKETVERLIYILFEDEKTKMDFKYWVALGKKKFMGYEMMTMK